MRLSLQNTSDHVKVESNNKLLLHYLCIILTLNMLTKGMIDVSIFIVCSSGYNRMHVYSVRYYSTVIIF